MKRQRGSIGSLKKALQVVGVTALAVVFLLIAYMFLGASGSKSQPATAKLPTAATCSYPDKTFCVTENSMKRYVATGDFSDILENQLPIDVACDHTSSMQQYCPAGSSHVTVPLFRVKQQRSVRLLTRNQYIAFFRSYATQHGPFKFVSIATFGSDTRMTFRGAAGAEYTLVFIKRGTFWKLIYPAVSTTSAAP